VEIRTYPIESHNRKLVLGMARDISERKKVENELRTAEARQALVLNSLPMAFYIALPHSRYGVTWVSEPIDRIAGFTADDFVANADIWESRLHPDDRERVLAKFDSLQEVESIEVEYRWKVAHGNYSWFRDRAVLIRDDDGNPKEIVGTWLDVTDRKRKKEEELARLKRVRTRETTLVDLAAHTAVTSSDLESATRTITERVANAMEVERVGLWLLCP
jgi:PAS domain S-box-containing protein